MNKFKKLLTVSFAVLLLLSSLSLLSFAADEEEEDLEVFNDLFYAEIDDDYYYIGNDYYAFAYEDGEDSYYIEFHLSGNANNVNIADFNDKDRDTFVHNIFATVLASDNIEYNGISSKLTKVNGCQCAYVTYNADYSEDEICKGQTFIFTTKNYIYCVLFECYKEFDEDDMKTVLNSFSMNDEHFDGDSEIKTANFTDAPKYEEALENATELYYDDYGTFDGDDFVMNDEDTGIYKAAFVFVTVIFSVPFIVVVVLMVVFIRKYSKNKKKLREYEARYGQMF